MFAIYAMLSYYIANGNITDNLTATAPGSYYEIVNVQCDVVTKKTYSVGVRYEVEWNGSGSKHVMHTQARILPGCVDKKTIAESVIALPYVNVLK